MLLLSSNYEALYEAKGKCQGDSYGGSSFIFANSESKAKGCKAVFEAKVEGQGNNLLLE